VGDAEGILFSCLHYSPSLCAFLHSSAYLTPAVPHHCCSLLFDVIPFSSACSTHSLTVFSHIPALLAFSFLEAQAHWYCLSFSPFTVTSASPSCTFAPPAVGGRCLFLFTACTGGVSFSPSLGSSHSPLFLPRPEGCLGLLFYIGVFLQRRSIFCSCSSHFYYSSACCCSLLLCLLLPHCCVFSPAASPALTL